MYLSGYTFRVIFDDFLTRIHLGWFRKNKYTTPFWLALTIAYLAFVASKAWRYWNDYTPYDSVTRADSYWFAYITLLTVGLGDFYVQPQGLFPVDVVVWSFVILYGITTITAFLDNLASLIGSCFPERKEPLEYRLAREGLFRSNVNTKISKSLEILRNMVEERMCSDDGSNGGTDDKRSENKAQRSFYGRDDEAITPSGNTINFERIRILAEKKALLVRLLLDNQTELEDRIDSFGMKEKATDTSKNADAEDGNCGLPPTVEAMASDEETLRSILLRNQELRRYFDHTKDPTTKDVKDKTWSPQLVRRLKARPKHRDGATNEQSS